VSVEQVHLALTPIANVLVGKNHLLPSINHIGPGVSRQFEEEARAAYEVLVGHKRPPPAPERTEIDPMEQLLPGARPRECSEEPAMDDTTRSGSIDTGATPMDVDEKARYTPPLLPSVISSLWGSVPTQDTEKKQEEPQEGEKSPAGVEEPAEPPADKGKPPEPTPDELRVRDSPTALPVLCPALSAPR